MLCEICVFIVSFFNNSGHARNMKIYFCLHRYRERLSGKNKYRCNTYLRLTVPEKLLIVDYEIM